MLRDWERERCEREWDGDENRLKYKESECEEVELKRER